MARLRLIRRFDALSMKKGLSPPSPRIAKSLLERRRRRVVSLTESLPEASALPAADRHLSLEVRGRRFGYFLDDHHGDGRAALNCKTAPGVNETLAHAVPERFFIPKYVAARGWLGLWLDLAEIDWAEVEGVITEAYRLVAPRRRALTCPAESKPNSRMIKMRTIGVMLMASSIIDKRSPRPGCRAEHRATDSRLRTRRKRSSLIPEQLSLSSRYFLKRSKIDISQDVKCVSGCFGVVGLLRMFLRF